MNLSRHDSLDQTNLENLLKVEAEWYVSLFMPTQTHGSPTRGNPILFKNLIREAQISIHHPDTLQVFEEIQGDHEFWQNQQEGLALLGTPQELHLFSLPIRFEPEISVNNHFFIRPLLPYLHDNGSFLVLTLAKDAIHLWLGSHYQNLEEIPLPDIPTSFEEYLDSYEIRQEIQFRSGNFGGGNTALFHGHGDVVIAEKAEIRKFFSHFQTDIASLLNEYELPLVVVGLDSLRSIFMETCDYKLCLPAGISHQPESLTPQELQQKAWEIVGPVYYEAQLQAQKKRENSQHLGLVVDEIAKILQDSYQGKMEALFVSPSAHRWGTFVEEENTIEFHEKKQENSDDLVELAVHWTLKRGGEVYLDDAIPSAAQGLLRYQ